VGFLGRADDQVKIRGYRIELGEIRAIIETHPGVRTSAVVADRQRLVAYYVGHVGEALDLAEHCATALPDYMIPSLFVPLAEIPLNANGKLDRKALPDPEAAARSQDEFIAPRTIVEERIAAIFAELLDAEIGQIGVEHSFFTLGGHSILAVRLISRLQEEFELDLRIRLIFERPTVAGLAQAIEDRIRAEIAALSGTELADEPMLSKEPKA
jgi:acyl carrier protein